ncbi:hypothetical protein AVEN_195161-1 [Araneus ventricosus]|uniref:Uncharacterized protein n=1 Tax=Araneus ventricosus TaxID=182803 RepID=A0A4Y2T688_ARAVE|nr:hypothetical protein AVEN_195161-1 [Araneus ventricosus]
MAASGWLRELPWRILDIVNSLEEDPFFWGEFTPPPSLNRGGGGCALSKPRKRKPGVPAFNGKHLLPLLGSPRGDPGPSAELRCRCTGWRLSEWRGVTGTCFAPLLIRSCS